MRLPLPLSTTKRDEPANVGRLVNMQGELSERGPRIFRAPGVRPYRSGNGEGRGLHFMGSVLFSVEGNGLYADGSYLGEIPGEGRVSMADNGTTLVVAADGRGFAYSGTLAEITDADFPGATEFDYLDGYFTFIEPNSGRIWVTDLYSTAVDPLKFATAEGAPDNLVAHIVDHRQVVPFGTKSIELWWNSAAGNFPLERVPQGFIESGCLGGVAKLDNSVYWVSTDGTVRRLNGSTPVRVSTHTLEGAMTGYTGRPEAFTYTLEGHLCYVVSWPEATWVHDVTTGAWYERQSLGDARWRVCAAASDAGTVYVQDRATGAVGVLDPSLATEWGELVSASWTYPSVHQDGARLFHARFELLAEMGTEAYVRLEWSNDGGQSWHTGPIRYLGSQGNFNNRAIWHALGSARDRVYRVTCAEGPLNVIGTTLEAA